MKTYDEMTSDERFELFDQISAALDAGDRDEASKLLKIIPVEVNAAIAIESVFGEGYLRDNGYNMKKVDALYAQ
ncbi:MAG: hypothetical protein FWF99_00720 [Desulfovibrionaceae bacterium]|nr:hypothetical protein [Desulfovibrionaceae bacterium]